MVYGVSADVVTGRAHPDLPIMLKNSSFCLSVVAPCKIRPRGTRVLQYCNTAIPGTRVLETILYRRTWAGCEACVGFFVGLSVVSRVC